MMGWARSAVDLGETRRNNMRRLGWDIRGSGRIWESRGETGKTGASEYAARGRIDFE